MEVKRVRVSVACDACKKRRGKCAGTAPCDYCVEHSIPCRFSTKSKKRGPASKHPKPDPTSSTTTAATIPNNNNNNSNSSSSNNPPPPVRSNGTSAPAIHPRYTDFQYMDEYLSQFSYLPPFNTNSILSPTTLHHQMVRFAVLAHMAKSFGDHERCADFFGAARQISGQIFDEPTYDSAMAYVLLACICMMSNDKRAAHYAHLSWSHAKDLLTATKEWRAIQLLHQSYILTLALDESLAPSQKHSILSNYITNIKKSDQISNLSGCLIGGASLFLCLDPHKVRHQGFLAALSDINYTAEARDRHFQDIERTELLLNANLVNSPAHKWGLVVLVKMYRTLGELWSGNYARASVSAREMIEASQRPELADMMRNNTVISAIMPNLVSFGCLSEIMAELLKYFQPQPAEDGSGTTLVISPNISALAHNVNSPPLPPPPSSSSSSNHIENIINNSNSSNSTNNSSASSNNSHSAPGDPPPFSIGPDHSVFNHNHNNSSNSNGGASSESSPSNTPTSLPPPNFPSVVNLPTPNSRKGSSLFNSIINNTNPLSTIDSYSFSSFHSMHAPHLPSPLPSPLHGSLPNPLHGPLPPFPSSARAGLSPRSMDAMRSSRPPSPPGFRYPLWPQ